MIFIESKAFTKAVTFQLSEIELIELQDRLLKNPELGHIIAGTGGLRKIRISHKARGKGKRGGARVIYYYLKREDHLHLLLLYTKDEADDLTTEQKRILKSLVDEIKKT